MTTMEELEAASEKLRLLDERRAGQLAYRDSLIVKALAEGNTWTSVQKCAHITPRGIAMAVKRAEKH